MVDSVKILVELTEKQRRDGRQRPDTSHWDDLTTSVESAAANGDSSLAIKKVMKFVSVVIWDACHPKRGGATRRRDLTRTVLQWANHLILYSLCPPVSFSMLYEQLLQLLCQDLMKVSLSTSVANACLQLLTSITDSSQVLEHRVKRVHRMVLKGKKPKLCMLLKKFKDLKPQLVPWNLDTIPSLPAQAPISKSASAVEMEARFEALWKNRTPIDTELDDLTRHGRLGWEKFIPEDEAGNPPPSKASRFENPLPLPQSRLLFPVEHVSTLSKCQTVGDLYTNLATLETPGRTLSLLRNRATFLLLFANSKANEVQARFSVTLYHTLYNEFFGCVDRKSGNLDRQSYLLRRAHLLQEYLQQGIPVVNRFFAEFLINWDGKELFVDVINLLTYIQITDFKRHIYPNILSPLEYFLENVFSPSEKIFFLDRFHRLVLHWITTEYVRCKEYQRRIFGVADPNCRYPLRAISDMINCFTRCVESGLLQTVESPSNKDGELDAYVGETLHMCMTISRVLINRNMPIRLEVPSSLLYFSVFGFLHPAHMSVSLEYIAMMKHETLPMCERLLRELNGKLEEELGGNNYGPDEEGDVELLSEIRVAEEQVEDRAKEKLKTVTMDIWSVLTNDNVTLMTGHSIFRQRHWQIEDELIRQHLRLSTHVAFQRYSSEFAEKYSHEHGVPKPEVYNELMDESTSAYQEYFVMVSKHFPRITEFLETLRQRQRNALRGRTGAYPQSRAGRSTATSNATSGISSMQPSDRRRSNRRSAGKAKRIILKPRRTIL